MAGSKARPFAWKAAARFQLPASNAVKAQRGGLAAPCCLALVPKADDYKIGAPHPEWNWQLGRALTRVRALGLLGKRDKHEVVPQKPKKKRGKIQAAKLIARTTQACRERRLWMVSCSSCLCGTAIRAACFCGNGHKICCGPAAIARRGRTHKPSGRTRNGQEHDLPLVQQ